MPFAGYPIPVDDILVLLSIQYVFIMFEISHGEITLIQ